MLMNASRFLLTSCSLVITVVAAAASFAILIALEERLNTHWGMEVYPLVLSPYAGLAVLAVLSRKQPASAAVTTGGALVIAAYGVVGLWLMMSAIWVFFFPILPWVGCGIIALVLWGMAASRGKEDPLI
jgi:hypothetical protein